MIQGIIFDLDGVLIDSSHCHREAFREVLHGFGITDFVYADFAGWRTSDVFKTVFQRAGTAVDPTSIEEAVQRKSRLARERMTASNPIVKHCDRVLRDLARNYKLGLASSGSRGSIDWFLEASNCRGCFRSVLSGNDVRHAKPDPEIYLRSFQALGLAADECVVVEDAVAGVQAGCSAGATVIGLAGTCSPEALRASGASRVMISLEELLDLAL